MSMPSDTLQKIFIGVVVALLSCLGTVAAGAMTTISRGEVQHMISDSEARQQANIMEMRAKVDIEAQKIEELLVQQAQMSAKLDLVLKHRGE